jgi:lipopolysaccharide export system permease protein
MEASPVSSRWWLATTSRYLLKEFARVLGLALATFVGLYLCVDFFERFPAFLRAGARSGLIVTYFVLKIPLIVTQMMPAAVLAAVLLSLGALARRSELMAMRACGISLWQIGGPIAFACLAISIATMAWNEYVVPSSMDRAHYVERVRIKNKKFEGHFGEAEIWFHGRKIFTNVDRFDATSEQLFGVTNYLFNDDFRLERILTAPSAQWTGHAWEGRDVEELAFDADGGLRAEPRGSFELPIDETPGDLTAVHRDTDDLSFSTLAREVRDLSRKGIDTTDYRVDLWLKTAIPFVSLVMALIGIPLASRTVRGSGMAAGLGLALVVGFLYWIVLGLTTSLGRSGLIPAPIAAWSANVLFGMIGAIFFLSSD